MTTQLPLAWPAPAHYRFEAFDATGNEAAPALLRRAALDERQPPVLLIGAAGTGKTHLLIATAALAREAGGAAGYVALSRWSAFDGDALAALAANAVLCIDEIERCAGDRIRETALFDLYNRCRDRDGNLVLATRTAPVDLGLALPDLRSRLSAAAALPLSPLPEEARRALLRRRARERGFELDDAVIDFLFRRHRRDLPALLAVVERLDRESLARQRRVTVPLLRAVLDADEA